MLTLDNLSLIKDNKKIFTKLGLSVSVGSALIVTGKNGSGKTSLLKIIAGISKPDEGTISWGGEDIENFRDDFNGDSQFLGHKNFLKQELTVEENLQFYSRLNNTQTALQSALAYFNLTDLADVMVKKLSAGWQKRVMLAKLMACPATVWILDEPSSNLDKEGREILINLIKTRVREEGLVIIATHDEEFFELGAILSLEDY